MNGNGKKTAGDKVPPIDIAKLNDKIAALEAKIELMAMMITGHQAKPEPKQPKSSEDIEAESILRSLTTRQHVTLQMILHGLSNGDIAERFVSNENTVKTYVKALFAHCHTNRREIVVAKLKKAFDEMPADTYESVAGIPKDWYERYGEKNIKPDPYESMYRPRGRGDEQ